MIIPRGDIVKVSIITTFFIDNNMKKEEKKSASIFDFPFRKAYNEGMRTIRLQKSLGILYIIGAAFCFALMNLFVRTAGELPLIQKVFFRNFFAMVVVFFCLLREKEKFRIKKGALPFLFLRAGIGFLGVVLNFYAIDHLNISDASILNKLSPFFAILFSALMLKEKPTFVEILFVVITFGGAMFVVKPSFSMQALPAFLGFLSGMCAGFAYTCVRILGKIGERGMMTVFFFSAFSTVVSLPFMLATFTPMSAWQFCSLVLAGLSATGGQFFITAAYRKAPAKEIAVFDYSQVLFAALLGFFFLDQIPDYLSVIGYVIIIGSAIGKWLYHNRKPSRRQKTESISDDSLARQNADHGQNHPECSEKNHTMDDSSADSPADRGQ